jgi:uncharacterized membrane protein YecN with MAPEG domain
MIGLDKESTKKFVDGREFQNASKAQLNEAEYSPLLLAMLLYLHSKGVAAPLASTAVAFGQIFFFWGRIITGKALPFSPIGALPRYIGMVALIYEVFKTL